MLLVNPADSLPPVSSPSGIVFSAGGFPARSCLLEDYGSDVLTVDAATSLPAAGGALMIAIRDIRDIRGLAFLSSEAVLPIGLVYRGPLRRWWRRPCVDWRR